MPTNPSLTYSTIFNNLMRYLWGDDNPSHEYFIRALGDRLKGTARINYENALDVLDVLGWVDDSVGRIVDIRLPDTGETHIALFTIQFIDGSSILVEAPRGIGSSVEMLD